MQIVCKFTYASTQQKLIWKCIHPNFFVSFENLLFRMDQDKSLNISYDEWRDFLLLAPSSDLHDILRFWRHSTVSEPPNTFNSKPTREHIYQKQLNKNRFACVLNIKCNSKEKWTVKNRSCLMNSHSTYYFNFFMLEFERKNV